MGTMPGIIGKGPIFEKLDAFSKDVNRKAEFEQALLDLDGPDDLVTIGDRYHVVDTDPEKDHVNKLWFSKWWPEFQPLAPVAREGLKKALQLSIQNSKPLDCYWVCVASTFQMVNLLGDQQVTLLVVTPPPPISLCGVKFGPLDDIWLTKHASSGSSPEGEVIVSNENTVITTRVKKGMHL